MRLLDRESGREIRRLHGHAREGLDSLEFSGDGSRIIAAGGVDQTVRVWDVASGQSLWILKHEETVRIAVISPDGAIIAGAGEDRKMGGAGNVIRIWDAATGRQFRELRGHSGSATALAFSPDGKLFASGGFSRRQGFAVGGRAIGSPDLSDSIHLWESASTDLTALVWDLAGVIEGRGGD